MRATKYGAMEAYLLELVRQSSLRGFHSVLQYEVGPLPEEYAAALNQYGADVVFAQTSSGNLASLRRVTDIIFRVRAQVIQFHFSERLVVLAGSVMGRTAGAKKVVSMVHNVHHLTSRSRARWAYNRCDYVLAVSDAVRQDLLNGAVRTSSVRTHYLGLSQQTGSHHATRPEVRAELGVPDDAVLLANIAFDAPFKGVDTLVRAFGAVLRHHPDVYLMQIGVDPAGSVLVDLADTLGVSNRLRWLGIKNHGASFRTAADIYVQPSKFGEGLPLAIMEAMQASLPVVAT
ncbi:MAG: glycosyltransferase, partial [Gemmatimonadaceae bacterium]